MDYQYTKAKQIKLREVGLDERWLQERITEDPSILGLGDLLVFQREKKQPTGGRIDFLMYEPKEKTRYEIEVMLGTLDESHIIRTIEYWDVERRISPNYEHIAVIVAEDITNRFFNVISLLNKAVPIVALQLNALLLEGKLMLNFTKILDLPQEVDEIEEESSEITDRKYWENRSNSQSIKVMDLIIALFNKETKPKVAYNKGHVALGTVGNNFAWFHPRKDIMCHCVFRLSPDLRDELKSKLDEKGFNCGLRGKRNMSLMITEEEFLENKDLIFEAFKLAEDYSHR